MAHREVASWTLLIPVKHTAIAKSRLDPAFPRHRADLALAFAADTTAAGLATAGVRTVVVITDDPAVGQVVAGLGATVIGDEPDAGLNPALDHAARRAGTSTGIAALSADLPALRPAELARALGAVLPGRGFVADLAGTGTTLLAATAGVRLDPRFGPDSARAHRESGAVPIDVSGIDSVRCDVDTPADLAHAERLGVGRHTAAVLDGLRRRRVEGEAIA